MTLGAANGREVVIKLVPAVDESAPKVFKEFGRQVKKTYEDAQKTADDSGKAILAQQKKNVKEWIKSEDERAKATKQAASSISKSLSERIKGETSLTKAAQAESLKRRRFTQEEANEEDKFARIQESAAEKAAKAKIREQERAAKHFELSSKRMEKANEKVIRGIEGSIQGTLSFAKNIALLGLVGEKDTKKIIDGLIKIQAGFGLLSDGIHLVLTLSRAWKAVEGAAAAAAVAEAAAASIGAGGAAAAAGGAAGVAGSAAKGFGAGAAIAGGARWLGRGAIRGARLAGGVGRGAAGIATSTPGILIGGALSYADIGRTVYGNWNADHGAGFLNKFAGQNNAWYTPTGMGARIGTGVGNAWVWGAGARGDSKTKRMEGARGLAQQFRDRQEIIDSIRGQAGIGAYDRQQQLSDFRAGNQNFQSSQEAVNYMRGRSNSARATMAEKGAEFIDRQNPGNSESSQAAAEELYTRSIQGAIAALQAERQAVRELNQERVEGVKAGIDELSALAQKHRDLAQQWRNEGKSLGLKLADMNPMQREQARQAVAAVKNKNASQEQWDIARGLLGDKTEFMRKEEERRAAAQSGLVQELTGGEYKAKEVEERRAASAKSKEARDKQIHDYAQASHAAIEEDRRLADAIDKLGTTLEKLLAKRDNRNVPKQIQQALEDFRKQQDATGN
jgi:hypothetical protein